MPDGTRGVGGKARIPPDKPPFGPVRSYHAGPSAADGQQTSAAWTMSESFQPLNADRYVAVGYPKPPQVGSSGDGGKVAYPVLDLVTGNVSLPAVETGSDVPGTPRLLVYYDAQKGDAGLFSSIGGGAKQYRYAHWDLASSKVDWTVPVGEINEHTFLQPIGVDPKGQYFYFLKETSESRSLGQYSHADQATVGRVDLKTHQIDWTHDLALPGRNGTFLGSLAVQPSADFSKFAVLEYGSVASDPAVMPPQGFVVDVANNTHTTMPIPVTPYGVTFDRENRYLAVASNAERKLYRYDLTTNQQDMVIGTLGQVQTLAVSDDNAHLYVFTKGRTMEVRDWPTLKAAKSVAPGSLIAGQTHFNGEGMAVLPDGKHAVMTKTEAPYGFPDTDDFFSVGLGPAAVTKP